MTIEEYNDMILLVNTLDQVLDDFNDVCGHNDEEAEKILTDIKTKYKIDRMYKKS